jgi:hypothetical protein
VGSKVHQAQPGDGSSKGQTGGKDGIHSFSPLAYANDFTIDYLKTLQDVIWPHPFRVTLQYLTFLT